MRQESVRIALPEGEFSVQADIFQLEDLALLQQIYKDRRSLCDKLRSLNAREVFIPKGLSLIAFCLFTGTYIITIF